MSKKHIRSYGRLKINKLDWLLAIAFVVISLGSLWMSLGICLSNAGSKAAQAFLDLGVAFGFVANVSLFGQSAVVIAYNSLLIYGSLMLLIFGSIALVKGGLKDRVPGLVAEFVAALGFAFLFGFVYEYLAGSAKGSVNPFWPASLIFFLVLLFCIMVFAIYATFNVRFKISLYGEDEEAVEEAKEEQPVEEPAPVVEEQPVEEPVEEEVPEELTEEEEEAEEEEEELEEDEEVEEGEEGEENEFAGFGKRRKRIPFENKIRRAKPETREKYKALVAGLREYDFNDRKSIPGETFSYKKEKMIFITISGSILKVYFNLNPAEFVDSPIPIQDVSEIKKYSGTPAFLKVKSNLAVKRAIALGKRIAEEHGIPKK